MSTTAAVETYAAFMVSGIDCTHVGVRAIVASCTGGQVRRSLRAGVTFSAHVSIQVVQAAGACVTGC